MRHIHIAHSVDADDAFMFHALQAGGVDTRGFVFEISRADTARLNEMAERGEADIVAISAAAYPRVARDYLLLPHGASIGRGFGPVLVARRPMTLAELAGRRVGIPGVTTTAYLVLRLMQPNVVPVVIPIAPFAAVFAALDRGDIDAALLIHEGRLLFEQRGYAQVAELGEWWRDQTGLPLPLGVNVIRRALGADSIRLLSGMLREAIAYALSHREEVIAHLASDAGARTTADAGSNVRGDLSLAEPALLDRYLSMYANEDTRHIQPDARAAIDVLFARARAAGLLGSGSGAFTVEWAP